MIVDLERNDLSRVSEVGSIRWPELMAQHELAGVTHLVSTVEGRVRADASLAEILRATFPGGSITGAPKIAALDHIARLEPVGRGASMGALGTFQANGDFELALTIRTFAVAEGRAHLWVGGGIVWDSDPEAEIEESWVKARPLLRGDATWLDGVAGQSALKLLAVAVEGRGLVDPAEPVFRADDEALLRGSAAFETLPVYGGHPFELGRHLDRLRSSLPTLGSGPARRGRCGAACRHLGRCPGGRLRPAALSHRIDLVATAGAIPAGLEELRARGLRMHVVETGLPAAARRRGESDELRARARGASRGGAQRARRRPVRRGRDRARSADVEHLVAARRRALDADYGARRAAWCDAGRAGSSQWRGPRGSRRPLPARRARRGRRGVHHLLRARGDACRLDRRCPGRRRPARPRRRAATGGTPATLPAVTERVRLGGMALANGVLVHGPRAWACAVRTADGELKVVARRKRFRAADVRNPLLRGPARIAEVFALLPQVKRALPEAELPMERPRVLASIVGSAVVLRGLRNSSLRPLTRELVDRPALRGAGGIRAARRRPRRLPRRRARLDRHLRARRVAARRSTSAAAPI